MKTFTSCRKALTAMRNQMSVGVSQSWSKILARMIFIYTRISTEKLLFWTIFLFFVYVVVFF
jgi:hypothetical protein